MSTRPVVSLVLPVYNVAAYLPACLDSLVAQTRPYDEIIAVDDGSTDSCPAILAQYASRLPRPDPRRAADHLARFSEEAFRARVAGALESLERA